MGLSPFSTREPSPQLPQVPEAAVQLQPQRRTQCESLALVNVLDFTTEAGHKYCFDSATCVVMPESLAHRIPEVDGAPTTTNVPSAQDIETHIKRFGLGELIIEVTTACNHRCRYCVFSSAYTAQREHGRRGISDRDVVRAVDFYLNMIDEGALANPHRKPIITFYGGEPLINYRAIRLAVERAESRCATRPTFLLTTNATLLNASIIKHMVEHEFIPLFSIDGDSESHDRNRRFVNNRPTHQRVVARVREYVRVSEKPAFINAVVDPRADLMAMMNFFVGNPEFWPYSISPVSNFGTTYYSQFEVTDFERMSSQISELSRLFRDLMSVKDVGTEDQLRRRFLYALVGRGALRPFLKVPFKEKSAATAPIPYTGSCVPGDKLFVDVEGKFFACEKITRGAPIGDLERGFDYGAIARQVRDIHQKVISRGCGTCAIRNACPLCLQSFMVGEEIAKNNEDCGAAQRGFVQSLEQGFSLAEVNSEWIELFTTEYHDQIRALSIRMA